MFKRNSGSNEHDILQNQFTSYLSFAVSNAEEKAQRSSSKMRRMVDALQIP